jgi:phosphoribosylamine--glycine ligase
MKLTSKERKRLNVGLVGKDGRTTALRRCLEQSDRIESVRDLSSGKMGSTAKERQHAKAKFREALKHFQPDFVVIGPEGPLDEGFVDLAQCDFGIPCVGPTSTLSKLESSKAYARQLLARHGIPGNPEFRVFDKIGGIEPYLETLGHFVVKPDGLTGGKGVKVSDVHLFSIKEATDYCRDLFHAGHKSIVIEEKLEGEEFSLQSFSDGKHVKHMPIVQDHKRIGIGDTGPNTGGMGSYSCKHGSLPFLDPADVETARRINSLVVQALKRDERQAYKGVLYGGFIATRDGVRLIEYNVRFGDPEALNVLSLLRTDFLDVCQAIINGTLNSLSIDFAKRSTVCKYVVPENYPENPSKNVAVDLSALPKESEKLKIFRAAIDEKNGVTYLTGSRAIAFVGIDDELDEAEEICEQAAKTVRGPVYHRSDIGSRELIESKIDHMRRVRASKLVPSALIE